VPVLLADLVRVSQEVSSTRSRSRKVAALATALRELGADELDPGVAFLAGEPRQDRLDLGPGRGVRRRGRGRDRPV
jgi:DNA ligase 1